MSRVCVTHFHGDHCLGLPGVLQRMALDREARPLSHRVPAVGYRLAEPDGRRMLPAALAARRVSGPEAGRLQREGSIEKNGGWVDLDDVSEPRRGQKFAFVMDTRLCDNAFLLAADTDLLVCESTFADADAALADDYGHLTAGQAGLVAARAGARRLVLTHFSQRYDEAGLTQLRRDAAAVFDGDVVLAADLDRIPVPSR